MLPFSKYQGAGNDFILIDQRDKKWLDPTDHALIRKLCDRHFGIGADGLILLEAHAGFSFQMVYFNSDGHESTMCGNGGRCIAAFAHELGLQKDSIRFLASDGPHRAHIRTETEPGAYWVELEMTPVATVDRREQAYQLDTGSPHYVRFVDDVHALDVVQEGRRVRYSAPFAQEGINVNFASLKENRLVVRTYERGVENETLACGTGITAAAIAGSMALDLPAGSVEFPVSALGGDLSVRMYKHPNGQFTDIWLCGPAVKVFSGIIHPAGLRAPNFRSGNTIP